MPIGITIIEHEFSGNDTFCDIWTDLVYILLSIIGYLL